MNPAFWGVLDELVASSKVVIDRLKGSAHPRFPENIYPLDYGYLEGSTSGDGQGIDVWLGSGDPNQLTAVLCTADLKKRDAELKVLLGCTPGEMQSILTFLNGHPSFQSLLVPRPQKET
ncbi:inorganic pyrophosphatase [Deinococcus radiomollis]|uniref:inorganic pyrophosphatase n=1 Tax=Deinococcus radiomollis TaxID=468916 RepID=UPI003892ACD5